MKPSNTPIFLFSTFVPLVFIIHATFNTPVSIGDYTIPAGHLIELFVTFPVTLISYILILRDIIIKHTADGRVPLVPLLFSLVVMAVFGIGNGVHFSANSLSHFISDADIQGEVTDMAYFYDEQLSHWIWTPPMTVLLPFSLIVWVLYLPAMMEEPHQPVNLPIILGSVWFGVVMALSALESQMGPLIGVISVGLLIYTLRRIANLKTIALKIPTVAFPVIVLTLIPLVIAIWGVVNGGFPEPLDVLSR